MDGDLLCAPCLVNEMVMSAVTIVEGTCLCPTHAREALLDRSRPGPSARRTAPTAPLTTMEFGPSPDEAVALRTTTQEGSLSASAFNAAVLEHRPNFTRGRS